MRNEENPARRTRRSFLKKSAMAGMGAQSALIFSGLVMTSYAIESSTTTYTSCIKNSCVSPDGIAVATCTTTCTKSDGTQVITDGVICDNLGGPITCPSSFFY